MTDLVALLPLMVYVPATCFRRAFFRWVDDRRRYR